LRKWLHNDPINQSLDHSGTTGLAASHSGDPGDPPATMTVTDGLLLGMGRDDEFRGFVLARSPALLKSAYLLTGDRGHAEDLVQSALLRSYRSWNRVIAADDPYAYVRRILFTTFSRARRRRRVVEAIGTAPDHAALHDEAVEDRDQLRRALRELTARQRAVVVLRFYDDLGVEQVAELLGISVGTVKSQTSKALARLRMSAQLDENGAR
jgi:RNA polymerase sigma-70 factor (sigma-E family)